MKREPLFACQTELDVLWNWLECLRLEYEVITTQFPQIFMVFNIMKNLFMPEIIENI